MAEWGWSSSGPPTVVPPSLGWSTSGPQIDSALPTLGWTALHQRRLFSTSVGDSFALVSARGRGVTTSVGDGAAAVLARLVFAGGSVGDAAAVVLGHLFGGGSSSGDSAARAARPARGATTGVGDAAAYVLAHLRATGTSIPAGAASVLAHLAGLTKSEDRGSAGAAFSPHAPERTEFSVAGSFVYDIPPWARFIDVVGLGAGGGGRGGGWFAAGGHGEAGKWGARALERGVDIPWSQSTISGIVGGPGSGGPSGVSPGNGTAGNPTTIGGVVSADGGRGAIDGSNYVTGAGNFQFQGQTYVGGAAVTGTNQNGNPPGGGGSGGSNNNPGRPGAAGRASFYARQS